VPASVELVVMKEFRICPLCPASRGLIDLVRKNAHGYRDGDVFHFEKVQFVYL
jgi:hypothetical protein